MSICATMNMMKESRSWRSIALHVLLHTFNYNNILFKPSDELVICPGYLYAISAGIGSTNMVSMRGSGNGWMESDL